MDIAPPFAGILFGISNTAAAIPGVISPYIVGVITADVSTNMAATTTPGVLFPYIL